MPPAWTHLSRCLRVWPGLVAEAALGCTCRTCWRTCLICFLPTLFSVASVSALGRALAGVDSGHKDALVIGLAVGREGPREQDGGLVEAVVAGHHKRIDELGGGQCHDRRTRIRRSGWG